MRAHLKAMFKRNTILSEMFFSHTSGGSGSKFSYLGIFGQNHENKHFLGLWDKKAPILDSLPVLSLVSIILVSPPVLGFVPIVILVSLPVLSFVSIVILVSLPVLSFVSIVI